MARLHVAREIARELRLFIKQDRTWWLTPILIALAGFAVFVTFAQGSAFAPLIYALF